MTCFGMFLNREFRIAVALRNIKDSLSGYFLLIAYQRFGYRSFISRLSFLLILRLIGISQLPSVSVLATGWCMIDFLS